MSDHTHTDHTHREYRSVERDRGGTSGMAFILGAVVVVLGIVAFILFAGDDGVPVDTGSAPATSAPADGTGSDSNVNVTIDGPSQTAPSGDDAAGTGDAAGGESGTAPDSGAAGDAATDSP